MSTRSLELQKISKEISAICGADDYVFIEEPPLAGSKNVRVALHMAQVVGAIMAVNPASCYLVPVSSWKKAIVGRGNASKEEVASYLRDENPLWYSACGGDQNLVDATCISLYGERTAELVQL